ncbi:MAG TPA: hypothetical protein DF383_03915, partial [Deltaproteobacteria bacterium]|nr:hypothetical protein [Deltaproteobacteria bacterium]
MLGCRGCLEAQGKQQKHFIAENGLMFRVSRTGGVIRPTSVTKPPRFVAPTASSDARKMRPRFVIPSPLAKPFRLAKSFLLDKALPFLSGHFKAHPLRSMAASLAALAPLAFLDSTVRSWLMEHGKTFFTVLGPLAMVKAAGGEGPKTDKAAPKQEPSPPKTNLQINLEAIDSLRSEDPRHPDIPITYNIIGDELCGQGGLRGLQGKLINLNLQLWRLRTGQERETEDRTIIKT